MKALQFQVSIPRFIAAKSLGVLFGRQVFYRGPLKTIRMVDLPAPRLPGSDWVKIKTAYCGFCGSDLNLILLHDSPTASPFTSFPCIIGHEFVGEIVETGQAVPDFQVGDRVAVNPVLGCEARGIKPPCRSCRMDRPGNCENTAKGNFPPGMFIGITSGVNGGFAPFVAAHRSQLYRIPETLATETAVMAEPVSVALQAVFDNLPEAQDRILVVGGGVIGNLIIQSLRCLVPDCHITVLEPSAFAGELARKYGADEWIQAQNLFSESARITRAIAYKPMLGKKILMGGFQRIFDTVGNTSTLNLSLRLLTAMGSLSIVGIAGDVRLDLTPLWLKLQTLKGVYAYGTVAYNGRRYPVFELALAFLEKEKIRAAELVTHRFALADYEEMIQVNLAKGKYKAVKTVMTFAA